MDFRQILKDYNVRFEDKDDKLQINCPFHDDKNPSGVIFPDKGTFYCPVCNFSKGFYDYLAVKTGDTIANLYHNVHKKYETDKDKTIAPENIENWHSNIWKEDENAKKKKEELYKRAVTDELIRKHRLGIHSSGRISIPIKNAAGYYVNARLYGPGEENKFINFPKYGKPVRLFPIDQLGYDEILLVGGELKAIVAAKQLNKHGIGVLTVTAGEGHWEKEHLTQLRHHIVHVCMDIDEAGEKAAEKTCIELQGISEKTYKHVLPLDKNQYPTGDINDFIAEGGDLYVFLQNSIKEHGAWEFSRPKTFNGDEKPVDVTLSQAVTAKNARKKIKFRAVVSASHPTSYSIARKVNILCRRNQKNLCKGCAVPEFCSADNQFMEVEKESPAILKLVGVSEEKHHRVFCDEFQIPRTCREVSFQTEDYYNVEFIQLSEELSINNDTTESVNPQAYCVTENDSPFNLELNECYIMTGRMYPHPRNQEAAILISDFETTKDILSTYEPREVERLKIFQPKEWSYDALCDKLNEIYEDLEANITYIFQRRELHLGVDLAYHSVLHYNFDKEDKAWVEVLILGDTAQGKSKITELLSKFYGLGEIVDCKGATEAGIKGGMQKFGDTWFVTWGKIPQNDRRLVILEELKGMPQHVFASLTQMRSTGLATLSKIRQRQAQSRTRLVANSNPRPDESNISDYNYGVEAVSDLIGAPEDIRRFDLVLIAERSEVNADELYSYNPRVAHKYEQILCRELILWCWTRKPHEVEFEDPSYVKEKALELTRMFSDQIPIVDTGSMSQKLARLSCGLAGRTFSTKEHNPRIMFVRNCHVEFVTKFLIKHYSKPSYGYKDFTDMRRATDQMVEPEKVRLKIVEEMKHPKDFVLHALLSEEVDIFLIQNVNGWDMDTAREAFSYLVRVRALKKDGRRYKKTTDFTSLLKEMNTNGVMKTEPTEMKGIIYDRDKF